MNNFMIILSNRETFQILEIHIKSGASFWVVMKNYQLKKNYVKIIFQKSIL